MPEIEQIGQSNDFSQCYWLHLGCKRQANIYSKGPFSELSRHYTFSKNPITDDFLQPFLTWLFYCPVIHAEMQMLTFDTLLLPVGNA